MAEYLRFCKDTEDKTLTILVVGSEHIIQPFSASILQANKSTKVISELKVHKCENIQQVLSLSRSCAHVDYIAFCVDSRSAKVIKTIEQEIGLLSKTFLLSRICLILCLLGGMSSSDINSVLNLRTKYQLHQLNGKTNNEESRLQLSLRLLRLVSYACGLVTGFPVVEQLYASSTSEEVEEDLHDASTSCISSNEERSSIF